MTCSICLHTTEVKVTGLNFLTTERSPPLWIGTTMAFFQSLGIVPLLIGLKLLSQIKGDSINCSIFKVVVSVRSAHCDYMPRDLRALDNCTAHTLQIFLHGSTTLLIQGLRFLDHTQTCNTQQGEWSAGRRDLYLTTHDKWDIHATRGIRTRYPNKRAAVDRAVAGKGHRIF
jgi:hypothetical protein